MANDKELVFARSITDAEEQRIQEVSTIETLGPGGAFEKSDLAGYSIINKTDTDKLELPLIRIWNCYMIVL